MLKKCNTINVRALIFEIGNSLKNFKLKKFKKLYSWKDWANQEHEIIVQSFGFFVLFRKIRGIWLSLNTVFFIPGFEKLIIKVFSKVSMKSYWLVLKLVFCLSHKLDKLFKSLTFMSDTFNIKTVDWIIIKRYIKCLS